MKKKYLSVVTAGLLSIGMAGFAQATPLDLSTFTLDGNVTVNAGTVTIDEADTTLWSSYFYDDNFFVEADALSLSVNYELTSGIDDIDWIVTKVDYAYDLEVTGPTTGTYTLDLTAYQDTTISLAFGLEADSWDWGFDSVATFSNFDITSASTTVGDPVPEPATMLLFGTGLAGLVASRRKRLGKSA